MAVEAADGVAEFGELRTGSVLPGAVAAGPALAAGELLVPLGIALLAGASQRPRSC